MVKGIVLFVELNVASSTYFQRADRKEICQIAGSTVTTGSQGSLTVIKLPAYRPEVFKQVIIYIYTGRVSLSVDTAPELLAAAAALGLESLRQHCHQHIADSLSAANACALLAAAQLLSQWYGDTGQRWRLLYRASDHDHSAQEFHRLCDGVAPTFTLCLGESGQLCGGFSDVAWVQSGARGRYIHSDSAFLFTLVNHQNVPPTRFPVKKRMYAICYHPQCGPIFGAGADLCISDRCDSTGESYSNLPHSYDGDGASSALLFGDYNFNVADYEVFTVA
ncbi:Serine-enriched protein [Amphibalanus amphitrite]|uniref:Serine-enriched protein n=1 Tax=Amphibalanus amphitrite TaxID=1232801 RepID=A0A6A4XCT7_AMPAM|nr:Serine-enriched protein [Amphibalanus amphitrite]